MKLIKNFTFGVVSLFLIMSLQGCFFLAGAAVGAGGWAYVSGSLKQNVDEPLDKALKATLKVNYRYLRKTLIHLLLRNQPRRMSYLF